MFTCALSFLHPKAAGFHSESVVLNHWFWLVETSSWPPFHHVHCFLPTFASYTLGGTSPSDTVVVCWHPCGWRVQTSVVSRDTGGWTDFGIPDTVIPHDSQVTSVDSECQSYPMSFLCMGGSPGLGNIEEITAPLQICNLVLSICLFQNPEGRTEHIETRSGREENGNSWSQEGYI
jgi:hypothetical protein